MDRRSGYAAAAGVVALAALLAFAGPAYAQEGAEGAGKTIGDTIRNLATPIIFSIGALTALGAFFKRDVGLAFTTLVITIVVGGFAVNPGGIESFTKGLWENIFPQTDEAAAGRGR